METNVEKIYREARRKREKDRNKNRIFSQILSVFIKSLLAGIIIAISCTAYLSVTSKYLGSAIFSVGFIVIFSYGLSLFTARVCYFTVEDVSKRLLLIPIWLGNFMGAFLSGQILKATRFAAKFDVRAGELCKDNLKDNILGVLLLSFFCGILMFIISDSFKSVKDNFQKYLIVIAATMAFILCGFEHSISNVFYFSVTGMISLKSILYLGIMTLGNALGGLLIPLGHKLIELLRK